MRRCGGCDPWSQRGTPGGRRNGGWHPGAENRSTHGPRVDPKLMRRCPVLISDRAMPATGPLPSIPPPVFPRRRPGRVPTRARRLPVVARCEGVGPRRHRCRRRSARRVRQLAGRDGDCRTTLRVHRLTRLPCRASARNRIFQGQRRCRHSPLVQRRRSGPHKEESSRHQRIVPRRPTLIRS